MQTKLIVYTGASFLLISKTKLIFYNGEPKHHDDYCTFHNEMIYYSCDLSRSPFGKSKQVIGRTESFRPEGVIYGRSVSHYCRRRYHRLRGLGRHESRSAQNALSRRGALASRFFYKTPFSTLFFQKLRRCDKYSSISVFRFFQIKKIAYRDCIQ